MRIGAYHHAAGKSVVFQYDLVDDAGTRFPESDAIFGRHALQEVIHFTVHLAGGRKVGLYAFVGLYQVVAVYRCRNGCCFFACIHELQQCHLRRGVLHGNAVGAECSIIFASPEAGLYLRMIQVGI